MTISINELAHGIALRFGNDIYLVNEYNHVKPGKGSAFVRVKLRNIETDQVLERTFKTAERLEDVALEERKLQVLYQSGDEFHLMDLGNYEQLSIPSKVLGDVIKFLKENLEVVGISYEGKILKVLLPNFMDVEITHTEPGIKGDSSRAGNKPATIDTGATVLVPLFVGTGDWIRIDTRQGVYVERLSK